MHRRLEYEQAAGAMRLVQQYVEESGLECSVFERAIDCGLMRPAYAGHSEGQRGMERRTFPCFIDFEASSLAHGSYPIEVAWSYADGRIESWLIDPSRTSAWTDWDVRVEVELHGLSREMLKSLGRSPSWVAQRMNETCAERTLYCDGEQFDYYWQYRLFQAAGTRPTFKLGDAGDLFERYLPPESLTLLARKARGLVGHRHRAVLDVHYQQLLWRLILGESAGMYGTSPHLIWAEGRGG